MLAELSIRLPRRTTTHSATASAPSSRVAGRRAHHPSRGLARARSYGANTTFAGKIEASWLAGFSRGDR
jgi:hypothetical protein